MPIICSKRIPLQTQIGLWYIEEDKEQLQHALKPYKTDLTDVLQIAHPDRQLSGLAVRLLVHRMLEKKGVEIDKDEYGKPYLSNANEHIGLSHSGQLAAGIISKNKCGIDIQIRSKKVLAIRDKFLNEREHCTSEDNLHIIWSAKESIYKAYGKKQVDFKRDIFIQVGDIHRNFGIFTGELIRHPKTLKYQLYYEIWNNYYLVYAISLES